MRKIDRLRHEALQSCKARGHVMGRFVYDHISYRAKWYRKPFDGIAECKICGAWVRIDISPAPNGIEIGGPAVAINCGDKP